MFIPLFDMDWTLVQGNNKAGYDSFDYAIKKIYGVEGSIREIVPHGMIDTQIIIEVLKLHSVSEKRAKEKIKKAIDAMGKYFLAHQDEGKYITMSGAKKLLSILNQKGVPLGLLTGNIKTIAQRKLERTSLKNFFSFGAFGDMAFRRVDLIDVAREQAEIKLGINISKTELVIIGDSPLDIKTAKAKGLYSIGVGAGPYSKSELKVAGADLVVSSLEEKQAILDFLGVI